MQHVVDEFNYVEAAIWFLIAIIVLFYQLKKRTPFGRIFYSLSFIIFIFGISDIIEAHTGAWWKPWWLLVLKGACIISMVWCVVKISKKK
jgi:ribose/xylose/arabinose/galactoside ABC-type transport system permease subunit